MEAHNWTNSTQPPEDPDASPTFRSLFGVVAGLALLGNLLLCIVMVRKPAMLTKTYNVLIFNLACADCLAGVFLLVTPRYIVTQASFYPLPGLGGDIFCRLFWSTYFLFLFGKASNATVMCLAIDRWYSIARPIKYKIAFGRKRLLVYIALTWLASAGTEAIGLFNVSQRNGRCERMDPFYGERAEQIFIIVHVIVTFYLPSLVTWCSFALIWYNMSRSEVSCVTRSPNVTAKRRLVRMCALAALFLTLCWFPTETFFVLKHMHIVELEPVFYWSFNLLAMANSCVNPWLYCLSNRSYRKEFTALLPCLNMWRARRVSWQPTVTHRSSWKPSERRESQNAAWESSGIQELSLRPYMYDNSL